MTNFEKVNALINAGVEFKIICTDPDYPEDTWTFYCNERHKLYPEPDLAFPFFWFVDDYGLDSVLYVDKPGVRIVVERPIEIGKYLIKDYIRKNRIYRKSFCILKPEYKACRRKIYLRPVETPSTQLEDSMFCWNNFWNEYGKEVK